MALNEDTKLGPKVCQKRERVRWLVLVEVQVKLLEGGQEGTRQSKVQNYFRAGEGIQLGNQAKQREQDACTNDISNKAAKFQ